MEVESHDFGRFAEFGMTCHVLVYIRFTVNDVILA
jgi:hypothetical protein